MTYRPRSTGPHRAKLLLTSPNGFNKEVSLFGQAKQPEPEHDDIEIDTPNIDFGTIQLQQGSSVTKLKSFRVTNNNQADVTLTFSSNTDAYTVSPEKVTISPRNTQTITVRLNVRGEGYYPGFIRVQSTQGNEERIQLSAQVVEQQRNDDRQDDHDQGDRDHDRDRDNDRDRDQQRGTTKYIIKEWRPKEDLSAAYCGDNSMGITYKGHIGIDENGCIVEEIGNQLRVTLKVIKIDDKPVFTHKGLLCPKIGKEFCTRIYTEHSYSPGLEAIYATFTMDKAQDTVWVLCKSSNGYRFYTKVKVVQR